MAGAPAELLLESRTDTDASVTDRWWPLIQRLETLSWIAPGERLTATETAGVGNMNRTLRIRLAAPGRGDRSLVLKQALPYVAKFPEIPAPIERGAVEAAFYQATQNASAVAAQLPGLVGFDADHHLLALEDLGSGGDFSTLYDRAGADRAAHLAQLPGIVDWLLALHELPVPEAFPANTAMRRLNHEHLFNVPFGAEPAVPLSPKLAKLQQMISDDAPTRQTLASLGDLYLSSDAERLTQQTGRPPVLLHGDYYPGSWLFDATRRLHIIDPEFAFVGPAEYDLGVMLAHLRLAGIDPGETAALRERYLSVRPINAELVTAFQSMEVLRRVFGVAQLPLTLTDEECYPLCFDAWQSLRA